MSTITVNNYRFARKLTQTETPTNEAITEGANERDGDSE